MVSVRYRHLLEPPLHVSLQPFASHKLSFWFRSIVDNTKSRIHNINMFKFYTRKLVVFSSTLNSKIGRSISYLAYTRSCVVDDVILFVFLVLFWKSFMNEMEIFHDDGKKHLVKHTEDNVLS